MALQIEKQLLMDLTTTGIQNLNDIDFPEARENKEKLCLIYDEILHLDAEEIDFLKSMALIKKLTVISPEMMKHRISQRITDKLKDLGPVQPLDTSFEEPDFN